MSNPASFYANLQQTPIENAYKFQTFSGYINNNGLTSRFSPICIFCSSSDTISLMNDGGSFRQCNKCKKQFRARFING
jgi:hypothetical protein